MAGNIESEPNTLHGGPIVGRGFHQLIDSAKEKTLKLANIAAVPLTVLGLGAWAASNVVESQRNANDPETVEFQSQTAAQIIGQRAIRIGTDMGRQERGADLSQAGEVAVGGTIVWHVTSREGDVELYVQSIKTKAGNDTGEIEKVVIMNREESISLGRSDSVSEGWVVGGNQISSDGKMMPASVATVARFSADATRMLHEIAKD